MIELHEELAAFEQALADAEDLEALRAAKKEEHGAPGFRWNRCLTNQDPRV